MCCCRCGIFNRFCFYPMFHHVSQMNMWRGASLKGSNMEREESQIYNIRHLIWKLKKSHVNNVHKIKREYIYCLNIATTTTKLKPFVIALRVNY